MERIKYLTIFSSIIIGAAATLWGLSQLSWSAVSGFDWSTIPDYAIFLAASAVILSTFSSWLKLNQLATGVVIAFAIAVFTGTVWPLIVTVWFGFASYVLGTAILALLKIDKDKQPRITAALVGAGAYGTAVGLAAHCPVNYPGLYGLALAAPVVLGWRESCTAFRSLSHFCGEKSVSKWHDLAIALIALVYFSVALMPEVGHDALAMHLFIPAHLATRHEWGFDVNTYVWAVMPMMGDWLFSIGFMLAGETAARLINVGFIFVMSWLVRDLVLWAGGSALGARWAVLLFLTTPLTFTEGSSLFIESIWAAFIIAGSLAVFKLLQNKQPVEYLSEQLKVAGLLLGVAAAAKAVTFTILPVLLLLLVLSFRTWGRRKLIGPIGVGLILFFVVGGIPYATAWFMTRNPVFPFFNQIFQSPFYPSINFDGAVYFGKGLRWDVFYRATFHSENFLESNPGAPGFQWMLLFFPALLMLLFARQRKGVILFAVAGASIALVFQSMTYLRYIFPSFAWVAAGIGVALSSAQANSPLTWRAFSIVGWVVVTLNLVFFKAGTHYGDLSLQALLSPTGRSTYLNNRLPIRNAIELVNQINSGRAAVAVFSSPLTAGLDSDGLYPNWYNYQFSAKVTEAKTSDHIAQLLMDNGVNYIIIDSNWGDAGKREVIENATAKISEHGSITVRELKRSYRFQSELLKNPDFNSYEGWMLPSEMQEQKPGRIIASVLSPSFQLVSVIAGRRYRNSITAVCKDRLTQGRVQVNWLDSKSRIIGTEIKVFDCSPTATTHAIEVTAPLGALSALVYATGHTSIPIIISEVSFK